MSGTRYLCLCVDFCMPLQVPGNEERRDLRPSGMGSWLKAGTDTSTECFAMRKPKPTTSWGHVGVNALTADDYHSMPVRTRLTYSSSLYKSPFVGWLDKELGCLFGFDSALVYRIKFRRVAFVNAVCRPLWREGARQDCW